MRWNEKEIIEQIKQENHNKIDRLELTLHKNETYIQ